MVLNEYIGNGQPWDLDRLYGGVHVLPPYQKASGSDWYKGTANAIYQNISFIESYDPQYVIILSGDQICKQDYSDFLRFHKAVSYTHLDVYKRQILVRHTLSSSTRSRVPTPLLASASTVYPPTPPIPKTATLALSLIHI